MRMRSLTVVTVAALLAPATLTSPALADDVRVVLNPYERVDWDTFNRHKAALHVHTLQSDGHHMVDEVVRAYADAGYSILALTDHDNMEPNAQIRWGNVEEGQGTHLPEEPLPDNYPHNTTWPWTDFEAPAPDELGLLGIEAAELTFRHHMNSFFTSYGATGGDIHEDDQLRALAESGGVAFLDHPGIDADWWTRRPVEWYVERFETHDVAPLFGMEITNAPPDREKYDEALWDQLLARFMPERPIWGVGTDDMHNLASVRDSHTVFLLDDVTADTVRQAMLAGQFYATKSTRRDDFRTRDRVMPVIHRIEIDEEAGAITIEGSDYDRIVWISAPESLDPIADYETSNQPWELGRVVHEGHTLDLNNTPHLENYVRAELIRTEGDHTYRAFTNPFGLGR